MRRLKRASVESFVGAVALGYLLAEGIMSLVSIFTAPLSSWIARKDYGSVSHISSEFSFSYAWPQAARAIGLLVLFYILLRWLYFTPVETPVATGTPTAAQ